jgi:non-specific serine/threonine protein kinase
MEDPGLKIIVTPSGRLRLRGDEPGDPWARKVAAGFADSPAAGVFALAASRPAAPPDATLSYWQDFAGRYLTELCRTPEGAGILIEPVAPPVDGELAAILLGAPPMHGGEYLRLDVLRTVWSDLDEWVRREIEETGGGLAVWLEQHAPLWRQVGRVSFHLAESKRDPEVPFAFLATYAPRLSKGGRVQYQPLGKALVEYAGESNRPALVKLLTPVHRASEKSAYVRELVESGDLFHPLAWTPGEAYRLLKDVPLLEESGLLVRLPDWWKKRPRPRVSVTVGTKAPSRLGAGAMLDFQVAAALGDEVLTPEELARLMDGESGLVQIRGRWVEVDRERLEEALAHWRKVEAAAGRGGLSFAEGMRLLAGAPADLDASGPAADEEREWSFVTAGDWLSEVLSGLRDPESLSPGPPSAGLCGTLRPYQETGHAWLRFLSGLGLGACLADDMGLGKTIQVLALLLSLKDAGRLTGKPALLVLPASLLANWRAELERFAPTLSARFVHPAETDRGELDAMAANPEGATSSADVVLTTYGMLTRQEWLLEVDWGLVVLDEAQAIKNPGTGQSRTVKRLKADARIALTGTPVENRLSDLWSLFDFLCPGLLGSAAKFKKFAKSLGESGSERFAPLRNLVRPYILRRMKTDKTIISDLPDKTEVKAHCGLAKKQAALYGHAVGELAELLGAADGIQRRGLVLAYLMRFKQICNHPSQLLGDGEYAPKDSGKFDRLRALAEEIAARQEKALVFTQFREMTEPLAAFLAEVFGREGLVLHGGTPVGRRRALVEAFQREEGPPFFVLSLKAGGSGLNLTAASHVVHFDRWWNPAVENQATDRAFRIGQHRNVVVHKFVCRGTVEEKIDALIEDKKALADGLLEAGGETLLTELSDREILDIVTLDLDRALM